MTAETSNARGEWVLVPRGLLEAAVCPMKESGCDGTQYPVQPYGEGEQCQWCCERRASLTAPPPAAARGDVRIIARDIHYAIMDEGLAPLSNDDNHKVREAILRGLQAVLAAEGVQAEPKAEAQLTYKGVPIGPMQTFADIERQASAPVGVEGLIEAAKAAESMLRTVHECASHECEDCREYAGIHANHLRDALAQPPADPRAATEQVIADALRRERMAPDDYAPVPDAPVPMEDEE